MNSKFKHSPKTIITRMRKAVLKKLVKYTSDKITYKIKVLKDILYNEKSHLVAKFKDFLLLDDSTEFFKRFYNYKESSFRLSKLFEFYDNNSKIFPNYIILSESRYIYKNIQRKQKLIDLLQYLEKKTKNKNKQKVQPKDKIFNSTELESMMKQSDFTNYDIKDIEGKQDVSASLDLLINVIEKAEKKIKIKIENDLNLNIINDPDSVKPTPKIQKSFKLTNIDFNNQELLSSNLCSYKVNNLNDNYGKLELKKVNSHTIGKDSSRTHSQSNTKLTAIENNKSKEKQMAQHTKFLSMPKLTVNNNVINNITIINNNSSNTKTIISYSKNSAINDVNNKVGIPKKNEFYLNFNKLNQKNTRNLKNNIIAGRNNVGTNTLNTLDLGKDFFSTKSKLLVSNITSNLLNTLKNESSLAKNDAPLTSRAVPLIKHSNLENNVQTIDTNNHKINVNNLLEDLNMIGDIHKLKMMKIKSCSGQKENYLNKNPTIFKIPQLKNKVNARQESNSSNKHIDPITSYPILKETLKQPKPISDRVNTNNPLKFLKTISKIK